ncbi:MAG: hypothetical protein L0Z62_24910 [Gemmataceae bacterium]|nr:hypothetical protein [Gemmataceae bacterium]
MPPPRLARFRAPAGLVACIAASACDRGDGLDTRISTELSQATFVVTEWPPDSGQTTPRPAALGAPPHTKCALRLRDSRTGTEYVLMRSTLSPPGDGGGRREDWPEQGDYAPYQPGVSVAPPSHLVRIACGTWRVVGVVPSGA